MHVTLEEFFAQRQTLHTEQGTVMVFAQDERYHPLQQLIRNAMTDTKERYLAFGSIGKEKKYTLLTRVDKKYNLYLLADYEKVIWSVHLIERNRIGPCVAAAESHIERSKDGLHWKIQQPDQIDVATDVESKLAKKLESVVRSQIKIVFL